MRAASLTEVLTTAGALAPPEAASVSDWPSGSSPTSAGSLRMSHHTSTKAAAARQARAVAAVRQPQTVMIPMTTGMKISCPVEPALFRKPSITPRWRTNQRCATLAASTDDMPPAPLPTMMPQTRMNSHRSSMNAVRPTPTPKRISAASITTRTP